MENKECTKCGEIKSLDDYYNEAKNPDGKRYACKECDKEYKKTRDKAEINLKNKMRRCRAQLTTAGVDEVAWEVYEYFEKMGKPLLLAELENVMPELIEAYREKRFLQQLTKVEKRFGLSHEDYKYDMLKDMMLERRHTYLMNKAGKGYKHPIKQLSLEGEHIKTYDSLEHASIAIRGDIKAVGGISSCASGKYRQAFGFIWEYDFDYEE